ncbi:MAG: thiaminase II [Sulfolobales archaeon]|nr:thiaminase II [Sulfolobales archaeon]
MSLTTELRNKADHIWVKIFNHPFVVELYRGELQLEKFKYYIIQDYNYLITMYRCFSLIASKADYKLARKALELAYLEATTEMANYEKLLSRLGLSLDYVVRVEPAPTNTAYMNFLTATCALKPPIHGLIALLPCFWSYAEIAEKHKEALARNSNELYVDWAKTYLAGEYKQLISELREIIDASINLSEVEDLTKIFVTASKYEYLFWEMSYRMESWTI